MCKRMLLVGVFVWAAASASYGAEDILINGVWTSSSSGSGSVGLPVWNGSLAFLDPPGQGWVLSLGMGQTLGVGGGPDSIASFTYGGIGDVSQVTTLPTGVASQSVTIEQRQYGTISGGVLGVGSVNLTTYGTIWQSQSW